MVFFGGNFQLWQEQCKQHIHKNKHSIIWGFFLIWHKTKWPQERQHPCDVSQDGDPTLEWLHMWWSTRVISCRFFLSVSTLEWLHMWWSTRVLSCRFFLSVSTLEWLHMWWSTRVLSCRFFFTLSPVVALHLLWNTRVLSYRFFISPYLGVATHVVKYSCTEL